MTHRELIEEIHRSWRKDKPRSFSVEIPPGCGATWFARELVDKNRNADFFKTVKLRVCSLDGKEFASAHKRDDLGWIFIRRIIREWGVNKIFKPTYPDYDSTMIEDHDVSGMLSKAINCIHNQNEHPILVIDNFNRPARNLDNILVMLRSREEDTLLSTVVISPVSLSVLKRRWQDQDIFFATSNYGDNHLRRFLGTMTADDLNTILREENAEGITREIISLIEKVLGNRAVSYYLGISLFKELSERSGEIDLSKMEKELHDTIPMAFDRFIKWLRHRGSDSLIHDITAISDGEGNKKKLENLRNHQWKDLLLKHNYLGLSCEGLAIAAKQAMGTDIEPERDSRLERVCHSLKYRDQFLNLAHLENWLRQFPEEQQDSALMMVECLSQNYFFSRERVDKYMTRLYECALDSISEIKHFKTMGRKGVQKNIIYVTVQATNKSESYLTYPFLNLNGIPRMQHSEIIPLEKALKDWENSTKKKPTILMCIDDIVGSGKTGTDCILSAFSSIFGENRDEWPKQLTLLYLAIVGYEQGRKHIEKHLSSNVKVVFGKELNDQDRVFSEKRCIFPDPNERNMLREFLVDLGNSICPKAPLGYSDGQSLVAFHYRLPNNSLPALHLGGHNYQGKEWLPLFQ